MKISLNTLHTKLNACNLFLSLYIYQFEVHRVSNICQQFNKNVLLVLCIMTQGVYLGHN